MRKRLTFVRFDERTLMLINELARKMKENRSVVIRAMVMKSLNELLDDAGQLILRNEEVASKETES